MALITATQFRQHFETDLVDGAIDRLIDAADDEIIARLGPASSVPYVSEENGKNKIVHLDRKASSVDTVVERIRDTDYALASDDFELLSDGFRVQRKRGSTYPDTHWNGRVTFTYTPTSEANRRIQLEIDLVKLAIQFSGLEEESGGGQKCKSLPYQKARNELFQGMHSQNRRTIF